MGISRYRKPLLSCAIILAVLLPVSGGAIVRIRATSSWSALEAKAASLEILLQQRDYHRKALWGETHAGAAFDGYTRALELAEEMTADAGLIADTLPHRADHESAATDALRARWQEAVLLLQSSAHCVDARPTETFSRVGGLGRQAFSAARMLVNMMVLEVRHLRVSGKHRQAVELSLDAAAFGADYARSGSLLQQMFGSCLVAIAVHEAWPDEALQMLDCDSLGLLSDGMAHLAALLPSTIDYLGEQRFMVRSALAEPLASSDAANGSLLRYGFSSRWMVADRLGRMMACYERLAALPKDQPWPQREIAMQDEMDGFAVLNGSLCQVILPNLLAAETTLRTVHAEVLLLGMATDWRRGNVPPLVHDPMGNGPIAMDQVGDELAVYSHASYRGEPLHRCVTR
jgi:hypothetical protein